MTPDQLAPGINVADVAASFQAAVVDVLVEKTVRAATDHGATEIYAACTHPVLSGPAFERLAVSPIREVVVTDTIPVPPEKILDKMTVLSIAPLLGESIQRIHTGTSVSVTYRSTRSVIP